MEVKQERRRDGKRNPVTSEASEGFAGGPWQDRVDLATVPGGFSSGVTMSPGAFNGRPGSVPGPNLFINVTVGASVLPQPVMHPPVQTHPAYHYHARGYNIGIASWILLSSSYESAVVRDGAPAGVL